MKLSINNWCSSHNGMFENIMVLNIGMRIIQHLGNLETVNADQREL